MWILEAAFPRAEVAKHDVARVALLWLRSCKLDLRFDDVPGSCRTVESLVSYLNRLKEPYIVLMNKECFVIFRVSDYDIDIVRVGSEFSLVAWDELAVSLASLGCMVNARLFDFEYDRWENQRDVNAFEQEGRSLRGRVVVRRDGERVIDIAKNPGRQKWGKGYLAAPGHKMWFGLTFFEKADVSKEALARCALKVEDEAGMVAAVFSEEPFTEANPVPPCIPDMLFAAAEEPRIL